MAQVRSRQETVQHETGPTNSTLWQGTIRAVILAVLTGAAALFATWQVVDTDCDNEPSPEAADACEGWKSVVVATGTATVSALLVRIGEAAVIDGRNATQRRTDESKYGKQPQL